MGWQLPLQFNLTRELAEKVMRVWKLDLTEHCFIFKSFYVLPRMGKPSGYFFFVNATNGEGWEHVSVSIPTEKRCPTWEEMCYIKDLFWTKDCVVVQFHPADRDYVNVHPFCLHLWRPAGQVIPTPPPNLIG